MSSDASGQEGAGVDPVDTAAPVAPVDPVVARLVSLRELEALEARYFRLMDTKQWDEWADVFTEDCTFWVADQPDVTYTNRDDFVAHVRRVLQEAVTTHHGHMPELTLDDPAEGGWPSSGSGIWAMFDYVQRPVRDGVFTLKGYGHYHETYRRCADGQWRISSLRLERLRVDHS